MIDFKDISVVVQGAVDFSMIDQVLLSVRTVLPEAEIILSTWEGVDYSPINPELYDKLVLSQDPGGFPSVADGSMFNNIDRQVVSSFAGISQATRHCCLKMRTDMILTHANFLNYFEKYNNYQPEYKLVKSRMLNNASGAVCPFWNVLLHPADFFFFGYTEDVRAYFSAPPFPEKDKNYQHSIGILATALLKSGDCNPLFLAKVVPEMYLLQQFLHHQKVALPEFKMYEISPESVRFSYGYMVNNFVMLSDKQLGYRSLKYPQFEHIHTRGFVNIKWQKLYKLLCDSTHVIVNEESDRDLPWLCKASISMFQNNELSFKLLLILKIVSIVLMFKPRFDKVFRGLIKHKKGYHFDNHEFHLTSYHLHLVTLMLADKVLVKGLEPFTNLDKQISQHTKERKASL
jgi:hypothetical protein